MNNAAISIAHIYLGSIERQTRPAQKSTTQMFVCVNVVDLDLNAAWYDHRVIWI